MERLSMCRICSVKNVRMYVLVNKNLHELYEKLTNIPFVTEDRRPVLACFVCCSQLNKFYRLLKKCLKAEELFAQILNEGYELKPLINQNNLEFLHGFIRTPIESIDIVEVQTENVVVKQELEDACEEQNDILVPKEECPSDDDLHDNYLEIQYMPPNQPESQSQDDVHLMKLKTEVEEEQEVHENEQKTMKAKDKRMGRKSRLWPSVARKKRCRVKGRFCNANKVNIPATMTMSESCSANISISTANVAKNLREANIVATLPLNWSPEGSSKQIIVQAEVHNNEPSTTKCKNVVPRYKMSSNNCRDQSNWDIIEPDVVSARNTPDLITPVTQAELSILEGNMIVDIAYLFEQIKNISHHPFQCNFKFFGFIKEQRTGFYSKYYFKSRLCNKIEQIISQRHYQESKENPINSNIIEGVSQTGNGWAQLDEICASINHAKYE